MSKRWPFLGLLVAIIAVLWRYFSEVIKYPDQYLFAVAGDAIKSYYCSLFYIRYNSGLKFTGMNYPHGESMLYTDGQPLLIELIRLFHTHVSPLHNYGVGVINWLIIVSPLVTGAVLYLILRHFNLPRIYAAAVALIITFLSPQFLRYTDQLSLSYTFIVPVMWWLIIKMFATRRPVYMAAFGVYLLIMGSLHPYVVVIGAVFLLGYLFVYFLQNKSKARHEWKFLASLGATALLPVLIFNVLVKLIDHLNDRPTDPYGFFDYRSTFSSVFFPVVSPQKDVWQQVLGTRDPIWEGMAYVGIVGFVCLILTVWKFGNYLFKPGNKTKPFRQRFGKIVRPALPGALQSGLWAAVLILLFSFCIPFRIDGFRWIPDLIGPLKQFRALGRFAWVFFYIFTVYSAYYFYQLYRYQSSRGARVFGLGLVGMLLVAWAVDARYTVKVPSDAINSRRDAEKFAGEQGNYRELLATANRRPDEFQAIFPLPFFHIGSEVFWIDGTARILGESMKSSFNTGLPIAAVMMGRTSLSHTLELMQLVGNPMLPRRLAKNLPSDKPFLLLYSKEELTGNEQYLLAKAEKIAETETMALYSLPVSAFANTAGQEIEQFNARKASLVAKAGLLLSEDRNDVVFQTYTDKAAESNGQASFLDAGSVHEDNDPVQIYSGPIPNAQDSTDYDVSVWYYIPGGKAPELQIRQFDDQGNEHWFTGVAVKRATDLFGDWVRVSAIIKPVNTKMKLQITMNGKKNMTVDNLLIRPVTCDVYYQSPALKMVVKNNFPLQPGL